MEIHRRVFEGGFISYDSEINLAALFDNCLGVFIVHGFKQDLRLFIPEELD